MYTTKNEEGHKIVSLTLTLKVNHQGQLTNFGLFEITDLQLVRIDTKIACIMHAINDKKDHIKVSLTLTFKVNCQSQVIDFVFFEILGFEKVRIDTEILSLLYIQPEIRKVIIVYINDLGFEGQPSRSSDLFQFF